MTTKTNITYFSAAAFATTLAALAYSGTAAADPAAREAFPEEVSAQVYLSVGGSDQPARATLVDSDGHAHAATTQASIGAEQHDDAQYAQAQGQAPAEPVAGTR